MDESTLWGDFAIVVLKFVGVVFGFGLLLVIVVFALAALATAIFNICKRTAAAPSEVVDDTSETEEVTPGT